MIPREEPVALAAQAYDVPIWRKLTLTFEEAAAYSGLGVNKLRVLASVDGCSFVIKNGTHALIKREALEEFLNYTNAI